MNIRLFSQRDLQRLAGRRRFRRGLRLVDTIDDLYEDEWSLCATVHDCEPHLAMVHHRGSPLSTECDCPDGRPGSFCEHAVYYLSNDDPD